jgi:hypothetical protein
MKLTLNERYIANALSEACRRGLSSNWLGFRNQQPHYAGQLATLFR